MSSPTSLPPLDSKLSAHLPTAASDELRLVNPAAGPASTVLLDGSTLTAEQVARIASGASVAVDATTLSISARTHDVIMVAARVGSPVYGLNVGVGQNKDRRFVEPVAAFSGAMLDKSRQFNIDLIRAHACSVGDDVAVPLARATMAVRLNMMLTGASGVQPSVIDLLVSFLNRGITPAMPASGSIGEADILVLSHIGMAMIGEGDVYYGGRRVPAAQALAAEGLVPIAPFGKDAIGIVSSNAFSLGGAALALHELDHLTWILLLVYATSLQALDGNVSPFLEDTLALRPFPHVLNTGRALRKALEGSSLWGRSERRPLQDPLSFRSGVHLVAELVRAKDEIDALMALQLNSSDDNPGVVAGVAPHSGRWAEQQGYVRGEHITGAVLPSSNFSPLTWVLALERLGSVLAHNSIASAQRVVRLNDPGFTGLPRYLCDESIVHGFGAVEKLPIWLAKQNKELARPVSFDSLPLAGGIEDMASNAPRVVEKVREQIDNMYMLLAVEVIHAAQAIDLRRARETAFAISPVTESLYDALREIVPFLDRDRALTQDLNATNALLKAHGRGAFGN
ncbi:histidine ammonia-lyase [Pandoraea iniqua]|uniref:Histidine ammonia-lyase n=2 Tax=Pandoraea iniqua TaxID=2508288 RepID=A0A5E4VUM5_9BURK|nr:histidine ammonia-lyase [Pandoraea iniqua]